MVELIIAELAPFNNRINDDIPHKNSRFKISLIALNFFKCTKKKKNKKSIQIVVMNNLNKI